MKHTKILILLKLELRQPMHLRHPVSNAVDYPQIRKFLLNYVFINVHIYVLNNTARTCIYVYECLHTYKYICL